MTVEDLCTDWFRPLDWEGLEDTPPAESVIPDLLNEGESGSLTAQGGTGKSLLMFEVCVSLALGLPVFGAPARAPMTVIYIDMENPRGELIQRLRSMDRDLSAVADSPLLYLSFPDLLPLDTPAGGRMLAAKAQSHKPGLIVLDTISRLVEGKEDSADTWRNLYNYTMLPLRRQGRTVLRLDHQGHDLAKGARGSSAKRDDVDVAWVMRTKGNAMELKLEKGRGLGHPEKVELRRHTAPLRHLPTTGGMTKVDECVVAMDGLGIPAEATRDDAGAVLRQHGYRFGNNVLSAAVSSRRPSPTVGTGTRRDD